MNEPRTEERDTEFWPGDKYRDIWPRYYKVGMWMWLLHRITGIYIIIYGLIHLLETTLVLIRNSGELAFDWFYRVVGLHPLIQVLDVITITCLLYHGLNGLRIILMDLGIGVKQHKWMFLGLMVIGAVAWIFLLNETLPYIIHRAMW